MRQRFLNRRDSGQDAARGTNERIGVYARFPDRFSAACSKLELKSEEAHMTARPTVSKAMCRPRSLRDRPGSVRATRISHGPSPLRWRLSPGLRVTDSTLLSRPQVTSWILGGSALRPGWTLNGSVGVSHQLPELHQVRGVSGSTELRPERARLVDVAIEHRLGKTLRWQATLFNREEAEHLREPDTYPGSSIRSSSIRPIRVVIATASRDHLAALSCW